MIAVLWTILKTLGLIILILIAIGVIMFLLEAIAILRKSYKELRGKRDE